MTVKQNMMTDLMVQTNMAKAAVKKDHSYKNINKNAALRVAAYIRVSTGNREQEDSYETQERYFSKILARNPFWLSAGIYSDYGLSGTLGEKRIGFQRLLRHCRQGKIDRIITKSISRFARNTSDFITALKDLRENKVTIFFEKENLDTADVTNDFILTVYGAVAQEESRSISENIIWGFNKRYPSGEARNFLMYGYRYAEGEDAYRVMGSGYRYRQLVICDEEAEVVRRVFTEAAEGKSYVEIARGLNYDCIPAPDFIRKISKGKLKESIYQGWTGSNIGGIVRMERYTGDVLLQKKYTIDYLNHKSKPNNGEFPQYHIKNHHPAIISREMFIEAQKVVEMNNRIFGRNKDKRVAYPFSSMIVCAYCGRLFTTYNRRSHPIWACPTVRNNNGVLACNAKNIYEEQMIRMFRKAVIERFGLITVTIRDDVKASDIISGCYEPEGNMIFTEAAGYFINFMKAKFVRIRQDDYIERDRSFLKRRILALQMEYDRLKKKKCLPDVFQKDFSDEESRFEAMQKERKAAEESLVHLENYWAELEDGYEWREKALEWMENLPAGQKGTVRFLNGLTAEYVKAFTLSITVHSQLRCTVHWFDDTKTEVEMYTGVEDHRRI